jgi:leucyl-tRNA synthetase
MEPLTSAAIAVATVLATKALEKTGENLGDVLTQQVGQLVLLLKPHAPHTATAIELAPQQPLDIGQAVREVDSAAKTNPEFERAVREVAEAAKIETNPKLAEEIKKEAEKLKYQQPTVYNATKLADYIKNFFQGNTIIGGNF